jgi:four helix bundle protein
MKSQAPRSKHQRSTKSQAPIDVEGNGVFKYPRISGGTSVLNDSPVENNLERHAFDLEERTALFGEAVIRFVKKVPGSAENDRLINQIVGCSTSIGANYCEANESVSKKDFRWTIARCVKEAKETKFFLRMIAASEPKLADEARKLYREVKELHLIFATMYRK